MNQQRDPYTGRHIRRRRGVAVTLATVALALSVGAFFTSHAGHTPVAVDSQLVVVGTDVCTRTIFDDGSSRMDCPPPPVVSPSGSASPTVPPTSPTPTPTATQTLPPTTPPPTTVPPTTVPPTTTPPATTPPPSPSSSSGGCPVAGKNVPGGADPWGGCWPGPGNTGVPTGTVLTNYTGPCTVTAANTVIDHALVTCATLDIRAAGVVIRMSMLQGTDLTDENSASASFTVSDTTIVNGARDQCACVGYHDFTALRLNVVGGNRGLYCELRCVIQDTWTHARALQGQQHASGMREEQFTTITHSTLDCDFTGPFTNSEIGCSAALTGYADFAPIHDSTVTRNLFVANPIGEEYCSYGGGTKGKPFSTDPLNGVRQVFQSNVYQKGVRANGSVAKCGNSGPVTDFPTGKAGSVWSANVYDDGTPAPVG